MNIYIINEQNLSDGFNNIEAFYERDEALDRVKSIIEEYGVPADGVQYNGISWYDDDYKYFDISLNSVEVQ